LISNHLTVSSDCSSGSATCRRDTRLALVACKEIAHHCTLSGGQIRNAALYGSLLAVDGGRDGEINDADLGTAVQREYRKAGASYPLQSHQNGHAREGALEKFWRR